MEQLAVTISILTACDGVVNATRSLLQKSLKGSLKTPT